MSAVSARPGIVPNGISPEPLQRRVLPLPSRHACIYEGCDKTFTRKEHLSRHAKSHDLQNQFPCSECSKSFSRSDSLVRHLARHGAAFVPNPSGRSKRACMSCHSGKTKCDGSQPCSTCIKKNIDCFYRQDDSSMSSKTASSYAISPGYSDQTSFIRDDSPSITPESPTTSPEPTPPQHSKYVSAHGHPSFASPAPLHHTREFEASMITMPPPRLDYIDLMSMRIQSDPNEDDHAMSIDSEDVSPIDRQYLDSFYDNFHHRWSLIHRPSFEETNNETPLIAAMKMIGAWLMGTIESKKYAIAVHERLINNLVPRLSGFESSDGLCLGMCETTVLTMVFALYYGNDKAISKAFTLRNLLVGVLREVQFFSFETAWADEKPGYFFAMHLMKLGQRQKLAMNIFKADTYLSLLRGQPRMLLPEELYFTLPPTHAVWDGDGLNIFQERYYKEPAHRAKTSMIDIITDNISIASPIEYPMLIEDVQLCLCATQSRAWKLLNTTSSANNSEVNITSERDSLQRMLHSLKECLHRMADQKGANAAFGDEPYLPLRNYFGYEDHSVFGWQQIVTARVRSLHFDAIMLSYLLQLHLSADIKSLGQLAKSQTLTPIQQNSERYLQAHAQRQVSARSWTDSSMGRQALCTAANVLIEHQNIARERVPGLEKHKMDPIAHITTSVAIIDVWSHCKYGAYSCAGCSSHILPDPRYTGKNIELANWCDRTNQQQRQSRQMWIENGGGMRVSIQGVTICACNVEQLTALFQACLPEDWEVADKIAAGIFER